MPYPALVKASHKYANIKNLRDGFWWAMQTVTTVGYGDDYPVTTDGKIVAAILMFASIGILGGFISALGSKLIDSRLTKNRKEGRTPETRPVNRIKMDGISHHYIGELLLHPHITPQNKMRKLLYLYSDNSLDSGIMYVIEDEEGDFIPLSRYLRKETDNGE